MRAITHYNWQNAFQGGGDLWGFNLNGMINWTRPFMLYWFQEISTIFFAGLHSTAFQRKFHFDNLCCKIFSLRILSWLANMLSFRIPNICMKGWCFEISFLSYHIFMAFMRDYGYQNKCKSVAYVLHKIDSIHHLLDRHCVVVHTSRLK